MSTTDTCCASMRVCACSAVCPCLAPCMAYLGPCNLVCCTVDPCKPLRDCLECRCSPCELGAACGGLACGLASCCCKTKGKESKGQGQATPPKVVQMNPLK